MKLCLVYILGIIGSVGSQSHPSVISTADKYDFIVSVPDVHGDLYILLRSLWLARNYVGKSSNDVISFTDFRSQVEKERVSPGSTGDVPRPPTVLLIQTGDIIDRGPSSRTSYEALWAAEKVLNWKLVNLLGNHEVMTMAGQADHYAHPSDVAEFGSLKSRRAEFSPGGKIWKKISDEYLIMAKVKIGDGSVSENILFVHAGINLDYILKLQQMRLGNSDLRSDELVVKVNDVLMAELRRKPDTEWLGHPESPIWTRTIANADDKIACQMLFPKIKSHFGISRMIVGHTPQEKLVTGNRCDSTLLLADVAMSRWMGSGEQGNPAVLIFVLGNNGTELESIKNLFWKGDVKGENGKVRTVGLYKRDKEEL